ncbi:MAG: arylsulfatase [Flavobacteriaceae bacterium]|nr:arylsulfatase [Flavobacteriaceae bacterium]
MASTRDEAKLGSLKSPNVLFILLDDLGWADLGSYGSQQIETPHLDQLARSGMRFTEAYAGHTVCAPSRCVLMTGKHSGNARIRGNSGRKPLLLEDMTVAEVFKQEGYTTGGFGKWGLGVMGSSGAPLKQGFDTFFGYYNQSHAHTYYPSFLIKDGSPFLLPGNARENGYEHLKASIDTRKEINAVFKKDVARGPKKGAVQTTNSFGDDREFSQYLILDETLDFIKKNRNNPFFCYAAWTPPHSAYHIPENDASWLMYQDKPWSLEARVHAAFISMTDRHIGQLLSLLDELQLVENTVVFFMSDNGASKRFEGELDSSGPLRGNKRSMHDGGIKSPLIVSWPGTIQANAISSHITYSADFFPTVVELIGGDESMVTDVDGLSLAPTLFGNHQDQKKHDYLYWEWPDTNGKWGKFPQALRHHHWKLVRLNPEDPWQLYDLSVDIGEQTNLADKHPKMIADANEWISKNTSRP